MSRPLHAALAGIALAGVLGLTACGGDSKDDAGPQASTTPSDAAAQKDCATTPGTTITVTIGVFMFDPTPVKVAACDSVVWHNGHDQPHTSTGNAKQTWTTGNIEPGASSQPVAFPSAGEFTYICALHPFMKGTVEVS